ncbi:hypothetical protein M0812_09909 [Anaeramoeba flamelloides]|uniref:Uncharacterized protein n=1 Tax=Anaeramoeba flamelloides TaxID=1746091 RepID=A0AAV7ZPZ7_9EUKA|nr:hypothetical protein M0812_09909 [Anaeramoeba flamelloides]
MNKIQQNTTKTLFAKPTFQDLPAIRRILYLSKLTTDSSATLVYKKQPYKFIHRVPLKCKFEEHPVVGQNNIEQHLIKYAIYPVSWIMCLKSRKGKR